MSVELLRFDRHANQRLLDALLSVSKRPALLAEIGPLVEVLVRSKTTTEFSHSGNKLRCTVGVLLDPKRSRKVSGTAGLELFEVFAEAFMCIPESSAFAWAPARENGYCPALLMISLMCILLNG